MADELHIQELVEEALNSERTPEEVCRDTPALLPVVRERLARLRELDEQCEVLFGAQPERGDHALDRAEPAWPTIPGYEVKGVLGRGGMGVVYRARHLRLDRDVALKMLLAGEFASARELERFFLEARAIANLSHANIVQVHDVSEREGRPYFTMELVEGGTLAHSLGGTPRPTTRAAELVGVLAGAIDVAHQSGIIHRDLKPANVLLTPDGIPKVTDFGLARHMSGGEGLTTSGAILGTPSYMAPEQIRGTAVGARADVYALGAILYETLTGRPPFRSESPMATQLQVLSKDPVRPSLLNSRVPRDLETICLHCLHKDPARRYESAAELAADLRRFLAHEPIHARPVGRWERALLWGRRNPAKLTVLSFGTVLLGLGIGRGGHDLALAREKREQDATWAPRVDGAFEQLRIGEFVQARSLLDQVPDALGDELRQRVSQARRELLLVEQLDEIRLQRETVTEGRFDQSENRHVADLAYEDAFRAGGVGGVGDDPGIVAARVRSAGVGPALIGALDDWAFCAGDGPRGEWLLDVARRSDSDPSSWRERLRDPYLRLEKGAAPLVELEDDLRENRMTVQLVVGGAERMKENGGDVIPLLTVVQRVHPGDFWANYALANVLWMQDPSEAIRYAQAAVAIRPRASIAHQVLGTVLRKAGRLADGTEAYRQAVLVDPSFAEAHGRLGLALGWAGKWTEAISEEREAIRLDPELPWVHEALAAGLVNTGRIAEALPEYRKAVQLDPRAAEWHQALGNCLMALRRRREALGSFQAAVKLADLPVHHTELGSCLASLGRFQEAEPEFRRALALDPANEAARDGLRPILVSTGRVDEAMDLYRGAIQSRPDDFEVWEGFPELCAYFRRPEDYLEACEELLERFGDTDQPRDCERIGRACLLLPSESTLPRAAVLIERALASPKDVGLRPYFGVAKALAEYRAGRFDSSIEILRGEAGGVLPAVSQLIRAMAFQRTGAVADARHSLASAALSLDWSPAAATDPDSWIPHVLRREAEALIVPELADLLSGRLEPRDDDMRAVMSGALVTTSRDAAAARLYESLFRAPSPDRDRHQRYLAARAVARAGAGLGVDPAEEPERAHFRGLVRGWLRTDLADCNEFLETDTQARRTNVSKVLNPWLEDPAFAVLRDAQAMEPLPPAERAECRSLWLEVETLAQYVEGDE